MSIFLCVPGNLSQECTNGIVHIVDTVLIRESLMDVMASDENLQTLAGAVSLFPDLVCLFHLIPPHPSLLLHHTNFVSRQWFPPLSPLSRLIIPFPAHAPSHPIICVAYMLPSCENLCLYLFTAPLSV